MSRLVLLDRDGTINVDKHYLSSPEELVLLPGAAAGIRHFNELGLTVAVVTNQSAVGRGYMEITRLDAVHERLRELLRAEGAEVEAIYVCPHRPEEGCACRKPLPGLARVAAEEWGADLGQSFVVGDKVCDIDLGRGVGAITFLVTTGYGAEVAAAGLCHPDYTVPDLEAAAAIVGRLVMGV